MALGTTFAMIGAAVVGGAAQKKAADQASQTIQDSSAAQIAETQRQYDLTAAESKRQAEQARADMLAAQEYNRNLVQPWVTSGTTANNALAYELGLGPRPTYSASVAPQLVKFNKNTPPINATVSATGGFMQPAKVSMGGLGRHLIGSLYNQPVDAPVDAPIDAPIDAADGTPQPTYEPGGVVQPTEYVGFTKTPSYDFRVKQGQDNLEASAAARGGLYSGAALKALQQNGQDIAAAEYDTYINRLAGLSANGQNAAVGLGGTGINVAGTLGQIGQNNLSTITSARAGNTAANNALMGDAANARANAQMAGANAFTGMLNNGLNIYGYQKAFNPSKAVANSQAPWLFRGNSWA